MLVIALATYNGGPFVDQLIASIAAQSHTDWVLAVGDDGSTDDTATRIAQWHRRDGRIRLLPTSDCRLGARGNFARILQWACDTGATYVACADQDDVWEPHKLRRQLDAMQRLESGSHQADRQPALVHTDLSVVDEHLQLIHPSLREYGGLPVLGPSAADRLRTLLLHNCVTGCTTLLNRPLLELSLPLPENCFMHDWWLALCAAAAGQIDYCPESTVLYRQHADNEIGATGSLPGKVWKRIKSGLAGCRDDRRRFRQIVSQGLALRHRIEQRNVTLDLDSDRLLGSYCRAFEQPSGGIQRIRELVRIGVPHTDALRKALSYLRILMMSHGEAPLNSGRRLTT